MIIVCIGLILLLFLKITSLSNDTMTMERTRQSFLCCIKKFLFFIFNASLPILHIFSCKRLYIKKKKIHHYHHHHHTQLLTIYHVESSPVFDFYLQAIFASSIPEIIELVGSRSKYSGEYKREHGKRYIGHITYIHLQLSTLYIYQYKILSLYFFFFSQNNLQ